MKLLSDHVYNDDPVNIAMRETDGNYLEIGTFDGVGAADLARRFPNKTIYVVDPFIEDGNTCHTSEVKRGEYMPAQKRNALANFDGLPNVVLYEQTNEQYAATLTDEIVNQMNVKWVLIDGSHHFKDVVVDYNIAMRLLGNKGGVIVFDDIRVFGVLDAYNRFQTEFGYRVQEAIWIGGGAAMLLKIRPNE